MPDIDGYKVVPLRLTGDAEHCHSIYMREHFIRLMDPNKPKGRTLFFLNVPPYVTEESLQEFYSSIGPVTRVQFAEKPGRDETENWSAHSTAFSNSKPPFVFKVAYVIFNKSQSLQRALEVPSIDLFKPDNPSECIIESGMQLWHSDYEQRILNEAEAQAAIDAYMAGHDERERIALEQARNSEADADGWVTVGKQGKNAGFEQKESVIRGLEGKIERGKKKRELTNFYTFQIRESKMKNIIDLRKKFEEDKKKIELLKQSRRFRPF